MCVAWTRTREPSLRNRDWVAEYIRLEFWAADGFGPMIGSVMTCGGSGVSIAGTAALRLMDGSAMAARSIA